MLTGDTVPDRRSSGAAVASPIAGASGEPRRLSPAACRAASTADVRAPNSTSGSVPVGVATRRATTISPFPVTTAAANLVPPTSTASASRSAAEVMGELCDHPARSRSVQRVAQVHQQVVDVLDSHGQPNQVIGHLQL